ncbi:MAG TPA: Yip1 family protein [Chloroflexota bacterium]|jgi:hypothetical protein|nr:Yip1 family protein [Chloroflexota bacterium]
MASEAATTASLPDRMLRAARLNVPLYEEVEADTTATTQALTVVVLVSLASGISSAIAGSMRGGAGNVIGALIAGIVFALVGWAIWSFVIYFVGTKIFGGVATYGEVLRTLGFAESPGVLAILGFIPVLGGIIAFIAGIWVIVASFIGTRQALDISNGKTIGTIVVAICVLLILAIIIGTIFGGIFALGMLAGGATRP